MFQIKYIIYMTSWNLGFLVNKSFDSLLGKVPAFSSGQARSELGFSFCSGRAM